MQNSVSRTEMNIILENKEKYAEEFSEGNLLLKKCLLNLWNNQIHTIGCCVGHEEKDNSVSYIGIDLSESNLNNVMNLLNNINKFNIRIGITGGYGNSSCGLKSFAANDNEFFENIINSLENNYIKNNNDFAEKINIVKTNNIDYLTFQYVYKNNNLVKEYCVTNNKIIIDEYKNKFSSKIYNEKNNLVYFNMLDYENKSINEKE